MSEGSAKQRIVETIMKLPDDATVEEAMECLYLLAKVVRGLDDARAGRTVSPEEIRNRFIR